MLIDGWSYYMIANNVLKEPCSRKKKTVWLSFLVFGFSNTISETEMAKQLSKRGGDVCLFAVDPKRDFQRDPDAHFILIPMKFVPIFTCLLYTMALLVFMPFYIVVKNPDYIITDRGTAMIGLVLKLLLRRPKVVLDIRSTPIRIRKSFREYLNAFLFRISVMLAKKKFDGMTILTEHMKKEICHVFDVDPKLVGVWTSGVSTAFFKPENYDGDMLRKKLGLDGKFIVFYHGDMNLKRGIIETIKSLEKLKEEEGDITLFLLGEGPYLHVLRSLVQELGVQNRVIFHRKVSYAEVPKYIAMCDVGIVPLPDSPNWRHQCPLKLLEYLAMKKVVIATDIPANREVMGESKSGIYISSTDPQEIAKAIVYVYNNREKLAEWGASGESIIEESYSWERVAEDFEAYLSEL